MGPGWEKPTQDITHLLDTIVDVIPAPEVEEGTLQFELLH